MDTRTLSEVVVDVEELEIEEIEEIVAPGVALTAQEGCEIPEILVIPYQGMDVFDRLASRSQLEEEIEVMKDEAPKLYEDGVIIDEMELEELEEFVAPGRALL